MSVQWTLVAAFLYVEIALVILLLLPFISAKGWQRLFKSKFLNSLANQANLYFMVFVVLLVLLFIDSIREMKKYSFDREHDLEHGHLDAELQHSMKLFRAQRNFYIAGFALFLCLVIRRLVTLLTAQATLESQHEAALKQAKSASEAAQKLMKSNAASSKSGDRPENVENEGNKKLEQQEKELRKMREELSEAKEQITRLKIDKDSIKTQADNVSKEYDRLMKEHEKLQRKYDQLQGSEADKDK